MMMMMMMIDDVDDDRLLRFGRLTCAVVLRPVLQEFISSRRRVKGIIDIGKDDDDVKSQKGKSQAQKSSQADDRASQAGDRKGHESEGEHDDGAEEESDDQFEFVEAEEPRDQWDCESITSTFPSYVSEKTDGSY